jgi:hypothetical protein
LVTPLKVYAKGPIPPEAVNVIVADPPEQMIAEVTAALAFSKAGSVISRVPVTGPQLFASVTVQGYATPAGIPVNMPVVLVTPLKVYKRGFVPPEAVIVTVVVPAKQVIGAETAALAVRTAGSVTLSIPETGLQVFASSTLHG